MSRRDQIKMTDDEVMDFLREARTMILVSNGKDGFPHPMPMWFAVDDNNVVTMTTFRKSQKIVNLKRDPKVALLVESGDDYQELKSIVIYTEVELLDDVAATRDILYNISVQRGDIEDDGNETIREGMMKTAEKRMGMRFTPDKMVTWDHSKLGGVY